MPDVKARYVSTCTAESSKIKVAGQLTPPWGRGHTTNQRDRDTGGIGRRAACAKSNVRTRWIGPGMHRVLLGVPVALVLTRLMDVLLFEVGNSDLLLTLRQMGN